MRRPPTSAPTRLGDHSWTVEPGTVVVVVVVVVDEVVEVGSHTTVVVGAAPLSP